MKTLLLIMFVSSALFLSSCGTRGGENAPANTTGTISDTTIQHPEILLATNVFEIDKNSRQTGKLNEVAYNKLQLDKLAFLEGYNHREFHLGTTLLATDSTKIITVFAQSSGEIHQYMITYKNGYYVDKVLVAYADYAESFSRTYSVLENNVLKVTTINNTGLDKSDSTIVVYQITPQLQIRNITEN